MRDSLVECVWMRGEEILGTPQSAVFVTNGNNLICTSPELDPTIISTDAGEFRNAGIPRSLSAI